MGPATRAQGGFWLPEDAGSIARCLSTFLRRVLPDQRQASLRLVAPAPLFPGISTVAKVTDLWWRPLLGDKWATLIKHCAFTSVPMEMIMPVKDVPRPTRMGCTSEGCTSEGDLTMRYTFPTLSSATSRQPQMPDAVARRKSIQVRDGQSWRRQELRRYERGIAKAKDWNYLQQWLIRNPKSEAYHRTQ